MTETVYAMYPCFQATSAFRDLDMDDVAQDVENLFKGWDEVTVRGVYSTRGFRADTDLMLWLVGPTPDAVQDALVAFDRTDAGRALELRWSFMGVVKPAEFTADHAPAFVKGEPPKRYASVYPFVRTPEWYLLPAEERAAMLREHGEAGREFPDVLANTTSAFGIGRLGVDPRVRGRRARPDRRLPAAPAAGRGPTVHEGGDPVRDRHPQGRPGRVRGSRLRSLRGRVLHRRSMRDDGALDLGVISWRRPRTRAPRSR